MSIRDIEFTNDEAKLTKRLSMNLKDCEKQIEEIEFEKYYNLVKEENKDKQDVENINIPYFNLSFWTYILMYEEIPTVEEFKAEYYKINKKNIIVDDDWVAYKEYKFPRKSFEARLLRTYASLIRDFHFYLMLESGNYFDEIMWSYEMDTFGGKDIIVKHKDIEFNISLFTETRRAKNFKGIKNNYRHTYDNKSLEVPLDLAKANKRGDIFLYGEKDVVYLVEKIYEQLGENICPKCKSTLVKKINRKTNQYFWGCPSFPKCIYSKDIVE